MKTVKFNQEIRGLDSKQLEEKLEMFHKTLFALRLSAATSHIKDYTQFKKIRGNIARVLTQLQKRSSEQLV